MARLPKDPWRAQLPGQRQAMRKQARFRSAKPTKPTVLRLLVIPPSPPWLHVSPVQWPLVPPRTGTPGLVSACPDPHGDTHLFHSQETLAEARRAPLLQTLSQVKTPVGLSPSSPWNPRTLGTRAAPRAGGGGCSHVWPRADTRAGVRKYGCSAHGARRGWGRGVRPSVPRLTIQMAPFTDLLPVPLPESGSYFQALLPKLGG